MRVLTELLTSSLGRLRRLLHLQVPNRPTPLKLNLGCGLAVCGDWVNIDGSLNMLVAALPGLLHRIAYRAGGSSAYCSYEEYHRVLSNNTFFHADLAYGIPAADGSAGFIYSSHFLEHLHRQDGERLLRDCYRVLQAGGVLRVCVPDLEYAVGLYSRGQKEECLKRYFFVESMGSVLARHRYMYDFELLSGLLRECGFHCVRRCGYREGRVPDIVHLDNRPEDTLYVEAEK